MVLSFAPGAAEATEAKPPTKDKHCAGDQESRWVLSQLSAVQTNPDAVVNVLRLGACTPLVTRPGLFFDYSHLEVGVVNKLTPTFAHTGGYLQVAPLSPLVLRTELSHVAYWPLGVDYTGYYPKQGYTDSFDQLFGDAGASAKGLYLGMDAILRAQASVSPSLGLLLVNDVNFSYVDIGSAKYYYSQRWDLILAQKDWVVGNELYAGLESPLSDSSSLRYGIFDNVAHVPASGYSSHQLGLFAMGNWPRPHPLLRDLVPFVRAGYYLDHAFRGGSFTVLGGLMTQYVLGSL